MCIAFNFMTIWKRLFVKLFSKHSYFIIILSVVLSACASLPDEKSVQSRAASASQVQSTFNSALQKAKLKIKKANSESLSFYAPSYYQKAQQSFTSAKSLYSEETTSKDAKLEAQLTIEYINSGIRNKKMVKDTLQKSLKSRKVLTQLGADKAFPKIFKQLEQDQISVIKSIEMQDIEGAKGAEKKLLKDMRRLEVQAIDHTYLAKTHSMLKQANALDAKGLMPSTYQKTLQNLADTQQFIRQNPRQELRIEELAQKSLFQAERLYSLSRYANQMKTAQDKQLESFILKQEEQLDRINKGFKEPKIDNLSFNDQSILLTKHAVQAMTDIRSYQSKGGKVSKAQLDKWKRKTVLLQTEVRRLQKALKRAQAKN
jgi:hypothetical protein